MLERPHCPNCKGHHVYPKQLHTWRGCLGWESISGWKCRGCGNEFKDEEGLILVSKKVLDVN